MITEKLNCATANNLHRIDDEPVDWLQSAAPIGYEDAMIAMKSRAVAVAAGAVREAVWLLEHPPLYTHGTSASPDDLLDPYRFPVYAAGRGGEYTYHGPGQRIAYLMLDLRARGRDVRCFVAGLENWLINTLGAFGVAGERRSGRIGVWVRQPGRRGGESKIAAIGVRVSKWVTTHGIALNVAPDLGHFDSIVPCGIADRGVTSLADLGVSASTADVDAELRRAFERHFGPTHAAGAQGLVISAEALHSSSDS